jgi:hypothetical protein
MLKDWKHTSELILQDLVGGRQNNDLPPFKIKLEAVGTVHGILIKRTVFCGFEARKIRL